MTSRFRPGLVIAAVAAALAWASAASGAAPPPESLLVAPDGVSPFDPGDGWRLHATERDPGRIRFTFRHRDGHALDLVLMRRGEARQALHQTRSFDVFHQGRLTSPEEQALLDLAVAAVARGDVGRIELPRRRPGLGEARPRMSLPAQLSWMIPLDRLQVTVAAALLVAFILLLPWIGWEVHRALADQPPGAARLTAIALAAGALARLLAPSQLVMIFMGYRYAQEVAAFTAVPKYGAGTFVLYRAFFEIFGPSHHVIVAVNTALGIATLPVVLAVFRRLEPGRHAVPLAAVLLAGVPLLVKDHVTESILVPIMLWVWCSLLAWDLYLERRSNGALVAATTCALLAVISRPEMLAIVPALLLLLTWWRRGAPGWTARTLRPLALAAAAGLVLLLPHLVHTAGAVRTEGSGDGLPNLRLGFLIELPFRLLDTNAILSPSLYPLALALLVGVALIGATGRTRRLVAGILGIAAVWLSIYYLDLPPASVPRLHAPAATLATLLAAAGGAGLLRRHAGPRRPVAALAAGLLALVAATAAPTVPALWWRTNDDAEDRFFLEAVARLPEHPVCFVRIGDADDPPKQKTHRYHPDYLLRPPWRDDLILGIRRFERDGAALCTGPAYFFQGMRCYAMYERQHHAPDAPATLSACARMHETHVLTPILERTVPNRHAASFDYYPDVPTLSLGLYRIEGRAGEAP